MTTSFDKLSTGDTIDGPSFAVSRESIRLFCDGSLDYNPLHLDDNSHEELVRQDQFRRHHHAWHE